MGASGWVPIDYNLLMAKQSIRPRKFIVAKLAVGANLWRYAHGA